MYFLCLLWNITIGRKLMRKSWSNFCALPHEVAPVCFESETQCEYTFLPTSRFVSEKEALFVGRLPGFVRLSFGKRILFCRK
jgi:hypothetical protein